MKPPAISTNRIVSLATKSEEDPRPFENDLQPRWYAVYTSANREKCVKEQLDRRLVESFLPLYDSIRRWKDRKVHLQLPLFPSYVFVCVALCDRLQVLQTPGVVRFVGFNGCPYALPESEVQALQKIVPRAFHAEPHPYLTRGLRVRVNAGPLAGCEGILVRKKSRARFVVSVDLIQRSVAVEVDEADLVVR
jgi:transcription antitermination factor NusG